MPAEKPPRRTKPTKHAENPIRRTKTAREMAERLGVSERTIRKIVAEPRHEFEDRARVRRERAVELRTQGLKYREIAVEMGISVGAVGALLHEARRHTDKASRSDQGQASA